MKLKKAYRSGGALVIALPKTWANALQILPGTVCCITLSEKTIHISRALVTSVAAGGSDSSTVLPAPLRDKGH